ncbi:MAG: ATP-binding cassette domain-containing protein [Tissierellaceae bacterium]|nr:ATP-binding cassette domain-containing protein [Tissierellaceae bacterium]
MLLEGKNLSFKYQKSDYIFKDVDIALSSNEIVGLMARSGYGKSTLAKVLAGYERPLVGHVLLDGQEIPNKGYYPVQLIYQHPEKVINPRLKMKDVLEERGPIDYEILDDLGIEKDWLTRYPSELSGGELQRFSVARILNNKTKFIIADEISTMLDSITQAQIWHVILDFIKKREIGVLAISHNKYLLDKICTKIIDLERDNKNDK